MKSYKEFIAENFGNLSFIKSKAAQSIIKKVRSTGRDSKVVKLKSGDIDKLSSEVNKIIKNDPEMSFEKEYINVVLVVIDRETKDTVCVFYKESDGRTFKLLYIGDGFSVDSGGVPKDDSVYDYYLIGPDPVRMKKVSDRQDQIQSIRDLQRFVERPTSVFHEKGRFLFSGKRINQIIISKKNLSMRKHYVSPFHDKRFYTIDEIKKFLDTLK